MRDKPLCIEDGSVSFGPVEVFRNLSLEVARGEFVAVVGPSGCGKTTLLNLFSGFLKPSVGHCSLLGSRAYRLPARQPLPLANSSAEHCHGAARPEQRG